MSDVTNPSFINLALRSKVMKDKTDTTEYQVSYMLADYQKSTNLLLCRIYRGIFTQPARKFVRLLQLFGRVTL